MALSTSELAKLAELARIEMSEEELAKLAPQLGVILESVAKVSEVATDDILPTSHALDLVNVFRADEAREWFSPDQALDQAPDAEQGRFRVPQILAEEQ